MKTNDDGSVAAPELRAFIESMPALAWSCRPDGFPEFINQRFHEYSGLSTDQIYEGWKSTLHPDDVEVFEGWWQGLQKSPKLGQTEVRFRHADGGYRWFQVAAAPVHDAQGNLIRWYGINTDIDDRKRAEQSLRQTGGELRTIVDAIRQAVVVLAPDGTTLYANRAALEITGLTIGEVSDNSFLTRAFHPEDVDRIRGQRQERLLRGVPFELEMRVLFKSGEYRWFLNQYNPLNDEQGGIIRWYVTGTDIDDQKRIEERLRNENLVLREEIDRSSMFEEIVGSCKPMRQVLKQVEKVAPSDSTVLILGETRERFAATNAPRKTELARSSLRARSIADPGVPTEPLFGSTARRFRNR